MSNTHTVVETQTTDAQASAVVDQSIARSTFLTLFDQSDSEQSVASLATLTAQTTEQCLAVLRSLEQSALVELSSESSDAIAHCSRDRNVSTRKLAESAFDAIYATCHDESERSVTRKHRNAENTNDNTRAKLVIDSATQSVVSADVSDTRKTVAEHSKRTFAEREQSSYVEHRYERKNATCYACARRYVHARSLCSICYNVARVLLKAHASDAEIIKHVRATLSIKLDKQQQQQTRSIVRKRESALQRVTRERDELSDQLDYARLSNDEL